MHIPDGYLSPETCAVGYLAMVPAWALAAKRVRRDLSSRHVPEIALAAAFSFLVMMFNIPVPGGTTAHAVGAGLVAILLGPWAAVVAVSVALAIQALLFGDGGILVFSINAFNMAWVMPWVAHALYRLLGARAHPASGRKVWAAAVAGYFGLAAAALCCAIELGLQPLLFHAADGAPLYSPYPLSQTLGAIMLAHLTVAGFAEAAITGGVVAYLRKTQLFSLEPAGRAFRAGRDPGVRAGRWHSPLRIALLAIGAMILLSPLGLLAPGAAFGESPPGPFHALGLSAIPEGLAHYYGFWGHALLNGYGLGPAHPVIGYFISALIGTLAIGAFTFAVLWLLERLRPARTGAGSSVST